MVIHRVLPLRLLPQREFCPSFILQNAVRIIQSSLPTKWSLRDFSVSFSPTTPIRKFRISFTTTLPPPGVETAQEICKFQPLCSRTICILVMYHLRQICEQLNHAVGLTGKQVRWSPLRMINVWLVRAASLFIKPFVCTR